MVKGGSTAGASVLVVGATEAGTEAAVDEAAVDVADPALGAVEAETVVVDGEDVPVAVVGCLICTAAALMSERNMLLAAGGFFWSFEDFDFLSLSVWSLVILIIMIK